MVTKLRKLRLINCKVGLILNIDNQYFRIHKQTLKGYFILKDRGFKYIPSEVMNFSTQLNTVFTD